MHASYKQNKKTIIKRVCRTNNVPTFGMEKKESRVNKEKKEKKQIMISLLLQFQQFFSTCPFLLAYAG
jgi:hypothetical protein